MWPAVKRHFIQDDFRDYVDGLNWYKWRPSKFVWHNTAAPTLAQWIKSAEADKAQGQVPGITRIKNLEMYFKVQNGWSGCPHLFIANDYIWVMNPLTAPGIHSPSFNNTAIGIEMIGDFSKEDDDFGEGLKVKNNTIFATAILCAELGVEPGEDTIFLHKQDPKTTHDCPGEDIARDKLQMIDGVRALMTGGEHNPAEISRIIAGTGVYRPLKLDFGKTLVDNLQFREGPGVTNRAKSALTKNVRVQILETARNGTTEWLKVKTPAGYIGWVSGAYVEKEKA